MVYHANAEKLVINQQAPNLEDRGVSPFQRLGFTHLFSKWSINPIVAVAIPALLAGAGCRDFSSSPIPSVTEIEWTHYGGDAGGTKYSPLTQINRNNVARLEVQWMVRAGDFPAELFQRSDQHAPAHSKHTMSGHSGIGERFRFESTPVMRGGVLYTSTPRNRVLALNPASGATVWIADAQIDITASYAEDLTSRGVAVWTDETALQGARCATRVFVTTVDARLLAYDGASGSICEEFGLNGVVHLAQGVKLGRDLHPSRYSVTSPPAVLRDIVIVGSAINSSFGRDVASGAVRAYDARTGELRWKFDPIPRTEYQPAWPAWEPQAAKTTGGANVWSIISVDSERDLIFLPTGSAAPDFYGGQRLGRNDFANSVVAVRGSTGEVVWSYQIVHHDLWDYDIAAQPVLITLQRSGRQRDAVVVGTKTGMLFVLDRDSGAPLFPVEERPVPVSDVPGEVAWPTQPFPLHSPLLHGTLLTPDSAFGLTETDRTFCRNLIGGLRNEGIFTPPSLRGTVVWPGVWGGINWDGLAWDPNEQLIITTIKRMAMVVQLHPRPVSADNFLSRHSDGKAVSQAPAFAATRKPLVSRSGIPCTPPPWGALVAVDLIDGTIRWQRPLGRVPSLAEVRASEHWGSIVFGGPLITAGGLVFVAASQDDRFRAFDKSTGDLLWEYQLPAGGQAAPMTYLYKGRQYIVIAAGGRSGIGSAGDWFVAFALPRS